MRPLLRDPILSRALPAALLLALTAAPSTAGTYYVNPAGSSTNNGTSPSSPWSLSKALTTVVAGDVVYFAPGNYSGDLRPTNSGISGARISFIGNLSNPQSIVIAGGLDLTARKFTTIKGVMGTGDISVSSYTASQWAEGDSVLYCYANGSLWANGSQNCHIANCHVGDGQGVEIWECTKFPIRPFNNTFRNNVIQVGGMLAQPHAIGFDRATNCEFTNNKVTMTMIAGATDVHGRIQYGENHCLFRDNKWTMVNYTGYLCYAFNQRDSSMYNTYERDSVIESPLSTSPCYIRFATAGSYPGSCGYNTFIDCVFKAGFTMDYQNDARGDVWQGCTLISGGGLPMDFSQVYSPVTNITFRHCTFYTTGNVAFQGLKSSGLRMVSNVFYSSGSACPGVFVPAGASLDSNLFFQRTGSAGSSWGAANGACQAPPAASRWGSPSFVDSSYANFNPTPRSNSLAIGSYWKDGYVGARPFQDLGPDAIPPSTVGNLATSQVTDKSLILTWTAPGDDGSSGIASAYDLRYSTSPITSANFDVQTQVPTQPVPILGGTIQSYVMLNLTPNTTYYFALKARDEANNWSGMSNVPSATTQAVDTTPPAQTNDLHVGP